MDNDRRCEALRVRFMADVEADASEGGGEGGGGGGGGVEAGTKMTNGL